MSAPSLRTQCPCVGFSCLFFPNRQLSTVGCELALPLNSPPAILTSPVTPKSFIRNAYKKHGGVGRESEANAMSTLPLRTLCLFVRISPLSPSSCRLFGLDCRLPLPTFPVTPTRPINLKPFICNAYKKHGGVRVCPPTSALHSPLPPSIFSFQLSTPVNPPGLTSRGTRIITEHRSRITAP
jgi:hypothetical protein